MRRILEERASGSTDIDVTPMLDVIFIMLIFFIVTASFVKEQGIGIKSELVSKTSPPSDITPIVIEVNELNEIRIQHRVVDRRAVRPTVVRLKAESPSSPVVVKLSPAAKTGTVVQAIDGIRQANVPLPKVSVTSG